MGDDLPMLCVGGACWLVPWSEDGASRGGLKVRLDSCLLSLLPLVCMWPSTPGETDCCEDRSLSARGCCRHPLA